MAAYFQVDLVLAKRNLKKKVILLKKQLNPLLEKPSSAGNNKEVIEIKQLLFTYAKLA